MKGGRDSTLSRRWAGPGAAGLALALCACRSVDAAGGGERASGGHATLVEAEHDVSVHLQLSVVEVRLVDGVREVEARLTHPGLGLAFEWSVAWFDRAGEPLYSPSARWRRLSLGAGESAQIRFSAPAAPGESWRLLARAAKGGRAPR
ncbi:MAG: hypothetical protein QF903_06880 [Planctomycetota bacterium]|jgi:hypothetical protein|nr:hypothetical protein [Planctomycetota bacterium]